MTGINNKLGKLYSKMMNGILDESERDDFSFDGTKVPKDMGSTLDDKMKNLMRLELAMMYANMRFGTN
jgi:hypothetical protein